MILILNIICACFTCILCKEHLLRGVQPKSEYICFIAMPASVRQRRAPCRCSSSSSVIVGVGKASIPTS